METSENSQCVRIIFRRVSIVEREVVCPNKHFSCSGVGRGYYAHIMEVFNS